jgi:uncharacterized protein (TIGR02246 family)
MSVARLLSMVIVVLGMSTAGIAADEDNPLKATGERYVAAFNAGDAKALLQFWAADADYTTSNGELFRGREAIGQLMTAEAEELKGTKLKVTDATVRLIKPEVAIQDGVLEFTSPDGVIDRSRFTAVWAKNNGQWQMASVRDLGPIEAVEQPIARENPLEQLGALVGEWTASDDLASVTLRSEWTLGKQFVRFDYNVQPKSGEPFTVMQIIGWDPVDETLRSWFFDSHGGHGSGVWFKTEKGWSVLSTGVTPTGQVGAGTYNYALSGKTLTLNIVDREIAGQPLPDAEVKFTRK